MDGKINRTIGLWATNYRVLTGKLSGYGRQGKLDKFSIHEACRGVFLFANHYITYI